MRTFRNNLLNFISCAVIGLLTHSIASAQSFKVDGDKPKFDDIFSPEIGETKSGFKPKQWLEIEAKLKVEMSPTPRSKTADRILVKWYVAVENPDKQGTYLLLTKDVTHVNIPLGEDVYSSVYLSPSSVRRITGGDRAGKSMVFMVGYEVLVNGVKVADKSSKGSPGWWNTSSDKISRSETVPLLDKSESAFAHMWWDRYAEISKEKF
ncbi:MAG: hypothetical protein RLZZ505_2552 [Verrucomicrobiota bacterium]|jgi:hypothetical protein